MGTLLKWKGKIPHICGQAWTESVVKSGVVPKQWLKVNTPRQSAVGKKKMDSSSWKGSWGMEVETHRSRPSTLARGHQPHLFHTSQMRTDNSRAKSQCGGLLSSLSFPWPTEKNYDGTNILFNSLCLHQPQTRTATMGFQWRMNYDLTSTTLKTPRGQNKDHQG